MILIMKNDYVTIYDMTINDYESMKSLDSALKQYEIYKVLKNDFSSELLKSELGDSSNLITCYYYDTGIKLERKDVTNISEIKYYEDENGRLWPSVEYYKMTERKISIEPVIAKLIGRDHELNQTNHILNLLTLEQIEEFKKYYDSLYINSNNEIDGIGLIGKGYDVNYYCKLILKDKIDKITSGKLNDCVFLIVIPAGYNTDNEMKYFVHPYKITKSDTDDISTIYKQLLNKDSLKVSELTSEGKIIYLEKAVKKYLQTEFYKNISSIQIGGTSYTWEEYRRIFVKEYKMNLSEFSLKWEIFDKMLVDNRKVVNGDIIPLITEYNLELTKRNTALEHDISDDEELKSQNPNIADLSPSEDEFVSESDILKGNEPNKMTLDELLMPNYNSKIDASANAMTPVDDPELESTDSVEETPVRNEPIVAQYGNSEKDLEIFSDPIGSNQVEDEDPFADMMTIDSDEEISPVEDEDPFADIMTIDSDEEISPVKDEDPFADMITIDSDEKITPVEVVYNDDARSSGLATLIFDNETIHDIDPVLDRLATYEYRNNQEFPNNWADTPKRK